MAADPTAIGPKVNILLVDDRPANLLALEAILDNPAHNLVRALSGEEALGLLRQQEFAVIVLDVQMPEMDGFQTARAIRGREEVRHTPIIFLTAYDDDDRFPVQQAYALGAVDYLVKPLVPVILRAKVAGFVELFAEKERAKHQAALLQLLIQGTIDYAIFMLDPEGRVATWNAGAERIKGYRAEEIIGQHFSRFYPREALDRGWPAEELRRAVAEGRCEDEGWRVRKDGSLFWASVVLTPLRDEAGQLRGFSKITRDLTERKQREEALLQLHHDLERRVRERTADLAASNESLQTEITERKRVEEALRQTDRRKDEFLAMLAHELRNPLAPIRNAVQVLNLLDSADLHLLRSRDIIERQVQHLTRLVDDLLDVSRITKGKVTLRKEPLALDRVVTRAVEASRPLFDTRGHALTVEVPPEPVWVEGDATRLSQVVTNLLDNAAKYTPEGGAIRLTIERDGNRAMIRVRDNGIGIPADLLPHVFELFTQGDRSLARSEGGLGIGLTLVKTLVEMHGGAVEAHSGGPGQGSEFVMYLPVREAVALDDDGGTGKSVDPVSPRRVLVVDDNRDAADSLASLLEIEGHEVRTAYNGRTALESAWAFRPDVLLLDIGLPGMDGYEVARQLRGSEDFKKVLLVAVTGYGQEEDRRRTREAGFDLHLVKPADLDALHRFLTR